MPLLANRDYESNKKTLATNIGMDFEIRGARPGDLPRIQELNLLLFKKEHVEYDKTLECDWTFGEEGTQYFRDRIEKEGCCALVATKGGAIIGYMVGGISESESYRKASKSAELENMFTLDEFRGKGIGKALLGGFFDWCKAKKVDRVKVVASSENKRGVEFYRRLGFRDYSLTLEKEI